MFKFRFSNFLILKCTFLKLRFRCFIHRGLIAQFKFLNNFSKCQIKKVKLKLKLLSFKPPSKERLVLPNFTLIANNSLISRGSIPLN